MPSKYGTSILRRFTNPRGEVQYRTSELMVNAGGYGIRKQIRGEAKEIQIELTYMSWTAGSVIWLRPRKKLIPRMLWCDGRACPWTFFACGIARLRGQIGRPHSRELRGLAGEGSDVARLEKHQK